MRKKNRMLSELTEGIELYPQVLLNVAVSKGKKYGDYPDIVKVMDSCSRKLGDRGRILVRPSGTEPKIRIMVEGEEHGLTKAIADEIASVIQQQMGLKE
jgi:phosphoglucosamine mutase